MGSYDALDPVPVANFDRPPEFDLPQAEVAAETVNSCANKGILVKWDENFACICPLDKIGARCESVRNWKCVDSLVSPVRNCKEKTEKLGGKFIEGDVECLTFHSNDTVKFFFTIDCEFTVPPAYISNNIPQNTTFTRIDFNVSGLNLTTLQETFNYYLKTDDTINPRLALTSRLKAKHQFRLVNFYTFSDESQNQYYVLDREHFLYQKPFGSPIWFGNLSSEYFAGERLYIEVGYSGVDALDHYWERFYIDFSDKSEPEAPVPWNEIIKWTGVAVAIAAALLILVVSLFCYWSGKNKKAKDLKEQ